MLPGAAVSILVGNLFYAFQAKKLAERTGRTDVCALPYGINTVSLFAHVFLVMLPAKALATQAGAADPARVAWQAGLLATLCSGRHRARARAFVAERVRKATPRAALLSTLAGIALGFISLGFLFRTFARPIVGLTTLRHRDADLLRPRAIQGTHSRRHGRRRPRHAALVDDRHRAGRRAPAAAGACTCRFRSSAIWSRPSAADTCCRISPSSSRWGSSTCSARCRTSSRRRPPATPTDTRRRCSINGIGSIAAALFGSAFPTTIYIGHPGWKALGARAGYSVLNGAFITIICVTGTLAWIAWAIPIDAGMAIVLWIGIVISAQAFQATPREHAPAVVVGLLPGIGAWGALMAKNGLRAAGLGGPAGRSARRSSASSRRATRGSTAPSRSSRDFSSRRCCCRRPSSASSSGSGRRRRRGARSPRCSPRPA